MAIVNNLSDIDVSENGNQPKSRGRRLWEWVMNIFLLASLIALCILLVREIIALWPGNGAAKKAFWILDITNEEQRYFALVMLGGALGAFVHAATSFADFLGNKKIVYSWVPWYILRPFIGSALAIIFYLLIRGGLLTVGDYNGSSSSTLSDSNPNVTASAQSPEDTLGVENRDTTEENEVGDEDENQNQNNENRIPLNPFGIMAVSCLAGLFSKQAIDKLREVFENLFQLKQEVPRHDSLNNTGENNEPSQTSDENPHG